MISTAVFSWARPAAFSLAEALMWAGSVSFARRARMTTVLVADAAGADELTALGIEFYAILPLPEIPAELFHLRDIVKLYALREAMLRFGPAMHHDFDVFTGLPLPARILSAPMAGEFSYYPADKPRGHLIFEQVADLRTRMGQPGNASPRGLSGGIFGGNDMDGILAVIADSLAIALAPENREAMRAIDGYTGSVMIGEMAFGAAYPDAEQLFPAGRELADYEALEYVHVAGGKRDAAKCHEATKKVAKAFPAEFDATCRRWRESL